MYSLTRQPLVLLVIFVLTGCTLPQNTPKPQVALEGTMNVADAAIAGGDPQLALSMTQAALASNPRDIDALVHEGDAFYALSQCIPAIAAYQRALQFDQRSAAASIGLGRCYLKTDPKAAEVAFNVAAGTDPGNAIIFNDLGIARDLQANFAGAAAAYQQSLSLNASATATEVNLGLSLALSGNGATALQYLGPLATGPSATPKIREDYAAALIAAGRNGEARQVLNIDLPPAQVDAALTGFANVIAGAQPQLGEASPRSRTPTTPTIRPVSVVATPIAAPT